jgi:pyrimidine deaminase RibD-like protein
MSTELSRERINDLCALAISEARKSVPEDDRPHPLVGAVLANSAGDVLETSYRGEVPKRHAEFTLFEKARAKGIDTRQCLLFVTLEPCSMRGPDKIPCAIRVAQAGVQKVFIGTLDPDPRITGRGEMYLVYQDLPVEHFESSLAAELRAANKVFFDRFRAAHFWDYPVQSLYGGGEDDDVQPRPRPARTREGILYQSLDLISASTGPIWISAGDLSWLRELQVGILGAALDGRDLRLMQHPKEGKVDLGKVASHMGFAVAKRSDSGRKRFTLVGPGSSRTAGVFIEPTGATLLRTPEDSGLLEIVTEWFEDVWPEEPTHGAGPVAIRPIALTDVIEAFWKHVPQYRGLSIQLEDVEIESLRPATRALERFKLFRISQLAALTAKHDIPPFAELVGSPWPLIKPPVVERLPNGTHVLVDGTHRAYSARSRGETAIQALVVNNPNYDLPSQPAPNWSVVEILDTKLPRSVRYKSYNHGLFRPIRAAYESLCGGIAERPAL